MHEQIKGFGIINTCISRFGIHIGWRKYLNEYTPFTSVSLWIVCDVTILLARAEVLMMPNDNKHKGAFTGVLSPQLAYAYFICICYVIIKWMQLMIYRIELIQLAAKFYFIFFQPFKKKKNV